VYGADGVHSNNNKSQEAAVLGTPYFVRPALSCRRNSDSAAMDWVQGKKDVK
jgi:hypothetical protein